MSDVLETVFVLKSSLSPSDLDQIVELQSEDV